MKLQAAMSTNMWIFTNGLNCGPTNYICSAIENELKKNRLKRTLDNYPLLFGFAFADDLITVTSSMKRAIFRPPFA